MLLTGETGTGKGLLAHVIHRLSRRNDKPLITVNCAALPSTLIESELFGHCRGAFTGATSNRIGRFEVANEGTIFLDEIGEMPLDVQAKLLRVLESGEFERVGSTETQKVDVRVIAATNRDLGRLAKENRFRRDLFYRLQVFPITVPPLRERPEDIPLLAAYVLESKCAELGRELKRISADSMKLLQRYEWPGNVRELENVIERAIILSDGPELDLDAEKLPAAEPPTVSLSFSDTPNGDSQNLDEIERRHILSVCESANWHIKGPDGAAARLGMNPSTLYFRMKKHGITRPSR